MFQRIIRHSVCPGIMMLVAVLASAQQPDAAPSSTLVPDVVGIRPGISAQEAYNLLKARSSNIQIGVGQAEVPGLGNKPIANTISAEVLDARAPEVLSVWLTLPPAKQVVWAIGRRLEYPDDKPLLKDNVVANLRQKYGQETAAFNKLIWVFDHQGRPVNAGPLRMVNYCLAAAPANLMIDPPAAATYSANSVLMKPPQPESACNSYIGVQVLLAPGSTGPQYTPRIDQLLIDYGLSRQSQVAYQDYLRNGANAKAKEDLEKAKERKSPVF